MKKLSTLLIAGGLIFATSEAFGHARLVSPAPRNNNAGIKNGPCGDLPRSATPTVWTAGQQVTLTWTETVEHPGKYLFAISMANDVNFQQVLMVPDTQNNRDDLPHNYSATFTVPNTPCEECTFQMIQSMEENPNNPSFYYSCADIRIVAADGPTPTPTPPVGGGGDDGQVSQSSHSGAKSPEFGGYGCGTVGPLPPSGGAGYGPMVAALAFMLMTLATYARLKRATVKIRPTKSRQSVFFVR